MVEPIISKMLPLFNPNSPYLWGDQSRLPPPEGDPDYQTGGVYFHPQRDIPGTPYYHTSPGRPTENPLGRAPSAPYQHKMAEIPWSTVAGMSTKNIGSSLEKFIQNTLYPFVHPVDFAQIMGKLIGGGVQKLWPGEQSLEPYADLFAETLAQQYGTEGGRKEYVATDPIGALSDVAALSGVPGLVIPAKAVQGAGILGKFARAAKKTFGGAAALDPATWPFLALRGPLSGRIDPNVATLMRMGIDPSIGQIIGGIPNTIEQKLRSVPGLGEIVTSAHGRAAQQMNQAAMNQVLEPIGKIAGDLPIGHKGAEGLKTIIQREYDRVLPELHLTSSPELVEGIKKAVEETKDFLSTDKGNAFERMVNSKVLSHLEKKTEMDGEHLKRVMTELGAMRRKYQGHSGDDSLIAEGFRDVRGLLDDALRIQNPESAPVLKAIDNSWARYKIFESATAMAKGGTEAGFSAEQLAAAAKKHDPTINKTATATGTGLMADLINPAVEVLGKTVPDSGTAGRAALTGALFGGGLTMLSPTAAVGALLGTLPYTSPGQAALSKGLAAGQPYANFIGDNISAPRFGTAVQQSGRTANLYLNPEKHQWIRAEPIENMREDSLDYLFKRDIPLVGPSGIEDYLHQYQALPYSQLGTPNSRYEFRRRLGFSPYKELIEEWQRRGSPNAP